MWVVVEHNLGYAGRDAPSKIVRTDILQFKDTGKFFPHSPIYLPNEIDLHNVQLVNPVSQGIENISLLEKYLEFLVHDEMRENLRETPLLLVEPPLQSKEFRLKLVELLFEKLEGCGLSLHKSALLTSYLYSKENSFIVDIGANYTHITPIFEGFVVSKCNLYLTKLLLG